MPPTFARIGYLFRKLVLDRIRYGQMGGYRAEDFWRDRFERHGNSSRGPGYEGLTEAENDRLYSVARMQLDQILADRGVWARKPRVLEIGPGTGIWTGLCRERNVVDYTGLDITTARFADLRAAYPGYRFLKGDASESVPTGPFDLVLCIDVIEHVVSRDQLSAFLHGLVGAVAPGGVLALAYPPKDRGRVDLYYLRFWPQDLVRQCLEPLRERCEVDFRVGRLFLYERECD